MSKRKVDEGMREGVSVLDRVRERVEEAMRQATESGEWVVIEVARVSDPATVILEIVVPPPRDDSDTVRPFLRIRTARVRNSIVVTPGHVEALRSLVELVESSDVGRAVLEYFATVVAPSRRGRVLKL